MPPAPAVERSVSGRCWRWRDHDAGLALAISQRIDLPEVIGRILAARGVLLEGVPAFIEPRLRDALPDPSHLHDLDRAVERLADAVAGGERVGLLGDYDVDGATSLALLARYLQAVGGQRRDRRAGPPERRLRAQPAGARAARRGGLPAGGDARFRHHRVRGAGGAAERGQEVIVVDHHAAEPRLPPALAVVNPNRCDQASPATDLAAVGVTFLWSWRSTGRCARAAISRARPSPICAAGSIWWRSARCATWCRSRASTARW